MRTPVLATGLLLSFMGCAPAFRPTKPDTAAMGGMVDAMKMAALSGQAQSEAQRACEPLLHTETRWEEERAIGKTLAVMLVAKAGHLFLDSTSSDGGKNALSAYVAIVGKNLARLSSRPDLPWVFGVIENDTPNAFNAPGGYVFVTTGLLKKVGNEAQLAGALAHEIGHVVHKHSLAKYRDAKHKQCVAVKYAAYLIEQGGPPNAMTAQLARYARNFEAQADLDRADDGFASFILSSMMLTQSGNEKEDELKTDHTALELVSFAGYDPAEYEKLLTALGPGNGITSSHPPVEERVAALTALRQGELKDFATGAAKPDLASVFAPLGK